MTGINDTITAICSGLSSSGINVIRISGDNAFEVAEKIFVSSSGKNISQMRQFSVNYGYIVENKHETCCANDAENAENCSNTVIQRENESGESSCNKSGEQTIIDEVLLLKMKAPHSYTKENVIEIDCHGGIIVTKRILELIIRNGARLAEPGEFTKRAFLNGRIDLSQAEAVADIINSKSELALKNSVKQLKGNVRRSVSELSERILSKTAYIEAALDDPEHISLDGFSENLAEDISDIKKKIEKLIKSADDGRIVNNGINTCILGLPNAGKSSLLNAILEEDRAIVTDIPGTTRDTLRESVFLGEFVLNIIDTAGIRDTDNIIEKMGVDRAKEEAESADLILYCIDGSAGLSEEDTGLIRHFADKKMIILINKTDINEAADMSDRISSDIKSLLTNGNITDSDLKNSDSESINNGKAAGGENAGCFDNGKAAGNENTDCLSYEKATHIEETDCASISCDGLYPIINISALTGAGIVDLKNKIKEMFYTEKLYSDDEIMITNARHKELLIKAERSIENVLDSIEMNMSEDFLTIDLMDAYTALKGITGESIEDDLADKIFKEFCMGK